jgi:hypothetical protein
VGFKNESFFFGHEDAFRVRGFSVRRLPDYLRLVKDHCEVHVEAASSGSLLRIPVVRAYPGEAFPERVLKYLAERNASPKGPGSFVMEDDVIWCVCQVTHGEDGEEAGSPGETASRVADVASRLVAQVERLGPKILNLR